MKLSFVKKVLGMTAALCIAASTVHADNAPQYRFKMATGWPGGPIMDEGPKAFAKKVEELSHGRIQIQVFPGGALGNPQKVSETVKNGIADMGHLWMGHDWGKDTTTVLFAGYAGSFDSEVMLHWLYQGGGYELQREFREKEFGLVSMPLFIRTPEVFLHSRKPVRTLADMQGLKLRTVGAWLDLAKELGAATVTSPAADVYTMLERGVIDATEWGTPYENVSPGFNKVSKYVIVPGVHQPTAPFELVINHRTWDKLSAEDQKMIENAARLVTLDSWLKLGYEDAKALKWFEEQGNEVIVLDPEVQQAVLKTAQKWGNSQAGKNDWFKRVMEHQAAFETVWRKGQRSRKLSNQ